MQKRSEEEREKSEKTKRIHAGRRENGVLTSITRRY